MTWRLVYTKQARKDAKKLAASGLKTKAQALLDTLAADPFQTPPPFEKLVGDLTGACSRRINIQHRLVYQVLDAEKTVKIIRSGATTSERVCAGSVRSRCCSNIGRFGELTWKSME